MISPKNPTTRPLPQKAKAILWDTWREHMTAWIKEERNHPSIYIWTVENEMVYININNSGSSVKRNQRYAKV